MPLLDLHKNDPVADRRCAVPGAVLRDEDLAAISLREHRARVESHPKRGDVRPEVHGWLNEAVRRVALPVLGIGNIVSVEVRETEIEPGCGRTVEFVGRLVVAQPVSSVVGEPEISRGRIPIEPDAVPDSARVHFEICSVGVHPGDRAVNSLGDADVARRTDRYI
jgi:hypothetical protein